MSLELNHIDLDHLGDLKRKGTIPIAPDGEGVPISVAIRLELAGVATINKAVEPNTVTIKRTRSAQTSFQRSSYR